MYADLLYELERTEYLLEEAQRIITGAGEKRLDGGRVKKRRGPRKKQKMTPQLRARRKLEKKVRKKLEGKKYRNKHTGEDISFSTAYNLGHPKAVQDYNKTMKSLAKKDTPNDPVNQLSDEQYDLITRVAKGRDIRDMSLVEERTLREAMATLTGIHEQLAEEGLDYADEFDEEEESQEDEPKKERKTRSDKGKKRGPYKKRVQKELEEAIDETTQEDIDIEGLVDTSPDNAIQINEVLVAREEMRDESEGDEGEDKTEEASKPDKADKPTSKKPTSKKPKPKPEKVYAERDQIIDLISGAIRSIQNETINDRADEVSKIEGKLFQKDLSPTVISEKVADLESRERNVIDLELDQKRTEQQLADAKIALKDLQGEEKKSKSEDVKRLETKLKETKDQIASEQKEIEKVEGELFSSDLSDSEKKKLKSDWEEKKIDLELSGNAKSLNEGGHFSVLEKSLESASKFTVEEAQAMADQYKDTGDECASAVSDMSPEDFNKYLEDEIKKATADVTKLKSKGGEKYAQAVGRLSALSASKEGILEDPVFGLPKAPKGEVEREEHNDRVRRDQGRKYDSMSTKQRDLMVTKLDALKKQAEAKLDGVEEGSAEYEEALGELNNIVESQVALNTSRMLKGEGVMDGFNEVEDSLLNLARGADDHATNEIINALSRNDLEPYEQRSVAESGMNNLPIEKWSEAVGGEGGPYGGIVKALQPNFCPATPENNASGVGGRSLDDGEECPSPVPDDMKDLMREFATSSMLDGYSVSTDVKDKGSKPSKKSVSDKRSKEIGEVWKANKEEFFTAIIEGKDKDGNDLSDEDKEEFLTVFQMELRGANLRALNIPGVRATSANDILKELERVRKMKEAERKKKIEELKKAFDELVGGTKDESQTKTSSEIFNSSFIDPSYRSGGLPMQKRSTVYVDYQERSRAFELGMRVYPFLGGNPSRSGIVVAVFPAIGMVDVQFPHGSQRYPVEDLVVDTSGDYQNLTNEESSIPGGLGVVPVTSKSVEKVASRYMRKTALYWFAKDRRYRACRDEDIMSPNCPRCKTQMGKTVYKRRDSQSEKLLACTNCLFIIKPSDIIGG